MMHYDQNCQEPSTWQFVNDPSNWQFACYNPPDWQFASYDLLTGNLPES